MILKDHIDLNALTGRNPLVGLNDPEWGPRFVPMHDAYDRSLQKLGLEGKLGPFLVVRGHMTTRGCINSDSN